MSYWIYSVCKINGGQVLNESNIAEDYIGDNEGDSVGVVWEDIEEWIWK